MKKILFITALRSFFFGFSQTQVSGKVVDESGYPVPFANIIFVGTSIGTYSDDEGKFSLYAEKRYKEIEVSYIGYTTKKTPTTEANVKNLTVILSEGEELAEIVIVAKPKKALSKKENPAYRILQGIWKNKSKNGVAKTEAYQYKKYSNVELGMSNLDSLFLQRILGNEYHSVKEILAESKHKENYLVPMYLKESVEHVYADNISGKQRIDIEAERSQGVIDRGFGLERFSRAFDEFDVYDNSYVILNRPFTSPLAEFGYGVYHYVLNDSLQENGRNFYKIYFFPKNDEDLALEGNFLVDDKSFIIKSIEMKTTPKTNINLVRSLFFEKQFDIVNDSVYFPKKDISEGDFTFFTKGDEEKGLYVKNIIEYSDFVLDRPKPSAFYDAKTVQIYKDQFEKDDPYWKKNELGSERLANTKLLIKKVGGNKRIKSVGNIIDIIGSGYVPLGNYLQLGSFWETFTGNAVEGIRLKAGFRTFITTGDRFRSYFYGAYGLKDKAFKYGVSAKYLLSHQPRIIAGAAYQNDNIQFGSTLLHNDNRMNFIAPYNSMFARGENYFLTRNRKIQGLLSFDLSRNLQLSVFGVHQDSNPADIKRFSIGFKRWWRPRLLTGFTDFNTGVSLYYTPGRNVFGYGVEQRFGKKLFSSYGLKYTQGVEGVLGSDFNYSKLQFSASRPIPLWKIGTFVVSAEAGKVFGAVPLPILTPTPTNQAYSLTPQMFTLLDYYDFVTDTYLNGYFEHHFDGYIMNRIPVVRKLRLRSLAFARFAYGTVSDENKTASNSNIKYNTPERLYWEYGFGFENIGVGNFRFVRVDFIWRSDFNDVNGPPSPKFGIRVGMTPGF